MILKRIPTFSSLSVANYLLVVKTILVNFFFCCFPAVAQTESFGIYHLKPDSQLEVREVFAGVSNLNKLDSTNFQAVEFRPFKSLEEVYQFHVHERKINKRANFWLKIIIEKPKVPAYLIYRTNYISRLNTIALHDGKITSEYYHGKYPFVSQARPINNFTFALPIDSGKIEVYLWLAYPLNLNFLVAGEKSFFQYTTTNYLLWGTLFGGLTILFLFLLSNLIRKIQFVDSWYILILVFEAHYLLRKSNLGAQFLWPTSEGHPLGTYRLLDFPLIAICVIGVFLTFLISCRIKRGIIITTWVLLASKSLFIALKVIPVTYKIGEFGTVYSNILYFPFLIGLLLWFRAEIKGPNVFYALLISTLGIGITIKSLYDEKLIPYNQIVYYAADWSLVLSMLFYVFYSSGYLRWLINKRNRTLRKLNQTQKQLILTLRQKNELQLDANEKLEQRVSERTIELSRANEEINRLNSLLIQDNTQLKETVNEVKKERIQKKAVSKEDFLTYFQEFGGSTQFLIKHKWGETFTCKKCGHSSFVKGKEAYNRRCSNCFYDESPTAGTILHRTKLSTDEAFYLLYLLTNEPNLSIDQLEVRTGINRITCNNFRKKFQQNFSNFKPKRNKATSWTDFILIPESSLSVKVD